MKTIITVSFLPYHLCLQASTGIHVDSACKQAKSDTFLIILGPSQFFGSLKYLIFLRFLSMVQFFGSAKIIIFTIFNLVPILWVSQFLHTIRYLTLLLSLKLKQLRILSNKKLLELLTTSRFSWTAIYDCNLAL